MTHTEKNRTSGIAVLSLRRIATAVLVPVCLASAPLVHAEPTNFKVDDEHFSMVFEIMHIGYAPVMGMLS
jgi:polyisoprenoid-binding protein YceI